MSLATDPSIAVIPCGKFSKRRSRTPLPRWLRWPDVAKLGVARRAGERAGQHVGSVRTRGLRVADSDRAGALRRLPSRAGQAVARRPCRQRARTRGVDRVAVGRPSASAKNWLRFRLEYQRKAKMRRSLLLRKCLASRARAVATSVIGSHQSKSLV